MHQLMKAGEAVQFYFVLPKVPISVADPYNFDEDTDPTFHFYANQDPAPHRSDVNLKPMVSVSLQTLHGSILSFHASIFESQQSIMRIRIRIRLSKTMRIRIRNTGPNSASS